MARLNEFARRDPARRFGSERRASLEARGVDLRAIMAELGVGERRAMAAAEARLGIRWHSGVGDCGACHLPTA